MDRQGKSRRFAILEQGNAAGLPASILGGGHHQRDYTRLRGIAVNAQQVHQLRVPDWSLDG